METWIKAVENYEVSSLGNCRRKLKNGEYSVVNCSISNRGYKYFQISRDNNRKNYSIHQLVAKLFIGDSPIGFVVDHIDRNKLNNNITNLRIVTIKDNIHNCDRYRVDLDGIDPNVKKIIFRKECLDRFKLNPHKCTNIKCNYTSYSHSHITRHLKGTRCGKGIYVI